MIGRPIAVLVLGLIPACAETWKLQYFHDKDDSSFHIVDFAFPSARRGIAVGVQSQKSRKPVPYAVVTADGGKTWMETKLPDFPVSIFFLDDTHGWMVTAGMLWKTEEAGRAWKKVKGIDGILRVHFLDETHGFAAGSTKTLLETRDGGLKWTKIPAAATPPTKPEHTTYGWITFLGAARGIVLGQSSPPRREELRDLPDWLDPETASKRRQWPNTMITLETRDSGATWTPQTVPAFGIPTRIRLSPSGRQGMVLFRFTRAFDFPSEVYWLTPKTNESPRAFRDAERMVTDVGFLSDRTAVLAAIEPATKLHTLPVPGKLRILMSEDRGAWRETKVDYRASGRMAMLSVAGDKDAWVALDSGMILKLEP